MKLVFENVLLGGEERYDPQEYNARLEVLGDLLKARGSALQYTGTSLFSSDGAESTPDRPTRSSAVSVTPTAGGARSSEDVELRISAQADELARLRRDLEEELLRRDRERDTGTPGVNFKEIFDAQAQMLATALKGSSDKKSSTIRIQPTFKPPVLGDEGKSSRDIKDMFVWFLVFPTSLTSIV